MKKFTPRTRRSVRSKPNRLKRRKMRNSSRFEKDRQYIVVPHDGGEYRFEAPKRPTRRKKEPKIMSFKDFDPNGMYVEDGEVRKKKSTLKKIGNKILNIASDRDVQKIAGVLLTTYIMSKTGGTNKRNDKTYNVLNDLATGRADYDTLADAKDILSKIFDKVSLAKSMFYK